MTVYTFSCLLVNVSSWKLLSFSFVLDDVAVDAQLVAFYNVVILRRGSEHDVWDQPRVLTFQVFQTSRLALVHPAILFPPTVVCLLGDPKLSGGFLPRVILAQQASASRSLWMISSGE
jgi:hypothetical protein